jgi:hypothetical protein
MAEVSLSSVAPWTGLPRADWRMTGYYRSMLAKQVRGNEIHRRNISVSRVFDLATVTLTVAFVVLLYRTLPAQAQPLGQKRPTATGNLVTVYSISWPTPVSDVSADVEVCAGPNAPANNFAFPSYFQLRFIDGGAIASYGSKKQPTFERTPLKSNQCVRRWLNFAVTSGQRPAVIRYHEMSADEKVIEWPVK